MGREVVGLRVAKAGLDEIDKIAKDMGVSRSVVLRAIIAVGLNSTPFRADVVARVKLAKEEL